MNYEQVVYGNASAINTRNENHSHVLNGDKWSRSMVLFKETEKCCMNTRDIRANGKNNE